MKIETKPIVDWNKAPYSPDNKISKEVRNALCKRFEVAIYNVRDTDRFSDLKLEDGWVIKSKTDVVFILNSDKNEDLPNNADLKGEVFEAGKIGAQLRKARDTAFDLEKYSELTAKVQGLVMDPNTGKITYKVI
jgi:hypothetical protein